MTNRSGPVRPRSLPPLSRCPSVRPTDRSVTEADWASYTKAVVDITPPGRTPFRLVPDACGATGAWPVGLAAPVVIVTAWNPGSVVLSGEDNRARNQQLVAELDLPGVTLWTAVGRDVDTPHHEDGVAVSGLTVAEGRSLGARHGQVAIFVWTPDSWAVVSCADDRSHTSGWRLAHLSSS